MKIGVFNNHARNGVRVSQYSKFILLGALAILSLVIVSLCVFSNLNALATDNIAFAHNQGYALDNLLVNNYALDPFWNSSLSLDNTTLTESDAVVIAGDTSTCSVKVWGNNLYLVDNQLRGNAMYFKYTLHDSTLLPSTRKYLNCNFGFVGAWSGSGTSMRGTFFNNGNTVDLGTYNVASSARHISWQINSYTFYSGDYLKFNLNSSTINLAWFSMTNNSSFEGYVAPSYKYYGYDQGYQDGLLDNPLPDADEVYENGYSAGYAEGYRLGVGNNAGFNFIGSLGTLGIYKNISDYFNWGGADYIAYPAETESIDITQGNTSTRYEGVYFDTQGDDTGNVRLGYCVNALFSGRIRINTILYGTPSRWGEVGFKFTFIDTISNTSFTLTREDTQYFTYLNTLRESNDSTYGSMYVVQFDYLFPNANDYRLLIEPINHSYYTENDAIIDSSSMLIWDNTYFFTISTEGASQEVINQLIEDAYSEGQINGRSAGYDAGRESGRTEFYNLGYEAGLEGKNYTFLSLFSSVIDAPIQAFNGLFNFEILGVNMRAFLLSILTLAIALFVWKIIVKGG